MKGLKTLLIVGAVAGLATLCGCKKNIKTDLPEPEYDVMEDWTLNTFVLDENQKLVRDENGVAVEREVSLSDFDGKVKLIVSSTGWCPPCRYEAVWLDGYSRGMADENFVAIETLTQNQEGKPADVEFAHEWHTAFNATYPVLADPDNVVYSYNDAGYIPFNMVVDENNRIMYQGYGCEAEEISDAVFKALND